ncbi:PUB12 [Symbiodinium sp. CCMP2592]|nr:PUB12 [Symbiodinium sp. CCMP2592]
MRRTKIRMAMLTRNCALRRRSTCFQLPTKISFEGRIVPGARTCWISFPAEYAACWDMLTRKSPTESVACIFQANEDAGDDKPEPDPGCGEEDRGKGWQSKWLEKVREAVGKGQRLKVALPPGQLGATQKMELAKAEEMGWSYEVVDVFDVLEEQFPKGHLVDAWCETTKSWLRATVEKQDAVDIEQEDGCSDTVVRWTLRRQLSKEIFDSSCICSTSATMKAMLDCVGDAKLRGILMECLPHVDVLDIGTHRLRPDLVALRAKLHIKSIGTLQKLRNRVLDGELEREINGRLADPRWEVGVSKSQFLRMYDSSLRALDKLTRHQRERLSVIRGSDMVHLSAPAGAGKTFVAVERVIDALNPAADEPAPRVLYVAATVELIYYFVQWLAVRIESQRKDVGLLSGLLVLFKPYKQLLQLRMPAVLQEGRIEFDDHDKNDKLDLLVIDECHSMYQDGVDRGIIDDLHCSRRLLLSDNAQSSAVTATFPEMQKVQMTEVVRSTRQIVLGAASFQVNAEAAVPAGTDGPPVKSYIFEAPKDDEEERMKQYARRVMDAIVHVDNVYSGVSLHKRLALFVPNEKFLTKLKKVLSPLLCDGLPDRKFRFVKQGESLRWLPESLRSAGRPRAEEQEERRQEEIILDTVDVVDGLEHLIVICVGLDAPIQGEARDLVTRADLYKGLTRAQLLAVVVSEEVEDGWFSFLSSVRYEDGNKQSKEEAPSKYQSHAAAKVWQAAAADALQKPAKQEAASEKPMRPQPEVARKTKTPAASRQKKVPQQVSNIWDARSNEVSGPKKPAFDPLRAAKVQSLADLLKEDVEKLRGADVEAQVYAAEELMVASMKALHNYDNRASIAAAGAIPPLVELLSSSTPEAQAAAAGVLRNLAADDYDNDVLIAEAGGIPALVELLRSSTPEVQAAAAGVLRNLAADDYDNDVLSVLIAEAGGIPALVELLRSSDPKDPTVQRNAAGALKNLSANADNKALIAKAGGIPPLVSCLTTGTAWAQQKAAATLGKLAMDWTFVEPDIVPLPEASEIAEANRALIASAGAIPRLIALLMDGGECVEVAAYALRPFSSSEDTRVAIVDAGAIPVLANLLTRSRFFWQHSIVGILNDLAENMENVAAIVEAEAVPGLVEVMGNNRNTKAQELAAELLLKLCAHSLGLSEAKASGALGVAAQLEVSGTPEAQEAAKRLVALLRPGR